MASDAALDRSCAFKGAVRLGLVRGLNTSLCSFAPLSDAFPPSAAYEGSGANRMLVVLLLDSATPSSLRPYESVRLRR
jgi:hypothetical protein